MTENAPEPGQVKHFFEQIRSSGLTRSRRRELGGVCGGVATRLGVAPTVARLAAVLLAVLGVGIVAYGIAWLLLPDEDGRIELEAFLTQGQVSSGLIGAVVATLVGFSGLGALGYGSDNQTLLGVLVIVGAVVAMVVYRSQRRAVDARSGTLPAHPQAPVTADSRESPGYSRPRVSLIKADVPPAIEPVPAPAPLPAIPAAAPGPAGGAVALGAGYGRSKAPYGAHTLPGWTGNRRPTVSARVSAAVAGVALISCGVFALLTVVGVSVPAPGALFWAAITVLVIIGLATVIAGVRGKRGGGLIGLGFVAVLATALVASHPGQRSIVTSVRDRITTAMGGISNATPQRWTLSGPLTEDHNYQADLGDATLDLSAVRAKPADQETKTVTIGASVGEVEVIVPQNLTVELQVGDEMGQFTLNGKRIEGTQTIGPAKDQPDLRLVGHADVGQIAVKQVSQ